MRISVTDKAGRLIEKMKSENSERKISLEIWSTIVGEALLSVPQSTWRELISRNTPNSYLFEKAMKDPKLTKEIAEFLKSKMRGSESTPAEIGREF